jgi:hypothetical protein
MNDELAARHRAITLRLAGRPVKAICAAVGRPEVWFRKWWHRYLGAGPEGLYDLPSQPDVQDFQSIRLSSDRVPGVQPLGVSPTLLPTSRSACPPSPWVRLSRTRTTPNSLRNGIGLTIFIN